MTPALPYREVLGSVGGLRRGFTTGTAAAAACAAAARMLAEDRPLDAVEVELPGKGPFGGRRILIPVETARREGEGWTAGVRKDAGDDDDATHGLLILCRASYRDDGGDGEVSIQAGEGIGVVTRPGLPVGPGEPAINPVPRRMILAAAAPWTRPGRSLLLQISAPQGVLLARETWNPRLGIRGGVSLIGTSGVVEPKSAAAFKASIALCLRQAAAVGRTSLILTLGHVGEGFLDSLGVNPEARVVTGDHLGFALERCASAGFSRIILAGHVGKLAKVAAGIFDTHWKSGDARLETLAACAAACGARRETVRRILDLSTAEAAEEIILGEGLGETYDFLAARAAARMQEAAGAPGRDAVPETGCAVLSLTGRLLGAHPETLKGEDAWRSFR